jgi:hypothetical protein
MVCLYTRAADRRVEHMDKLSKPGTSIAAAPHGKVRAKGKKSWRYQACF